MTHASHPRFSSPAPSRRSSRSRSPLVSPRSQPFARVFAPAWTICETPRRTRSSASASRAPAQNSSHRPRSAASARLDRRHRTPNTRGSSPSARCPPSWPVLSRTPRSIYAPPPRAPRLAEIGSTAVRCALPRVRRARAHRNRRAIYPHRPRRRRTIARPRAGRTASCTFPCLGARR